MARTYKRDANGRFAGGRGGSARPAAKAAPRGTNRLTRDNSGRITSVGGNGATARGGRLKTASGNLRATQTAKIKGGGGKLRGGVRPPAKAVAIKPDQAVVNIPMRGKRGKSLERDIDRAVAITKAAGRAGMKSAAQAKNDTKRLKSLRAANEPDMIATLKKRTGRPTAEIRSTLRARTPTEEIALIRRWVKEKRGNPSIVGARKARADKARAPKPLPNRNAAILKVRAEQLRTMRRNGASRSAIVIQQIRTMELRNEGRPK